MKLAADPLCRSLSKSWQKVDEVLKCSKSWYRDISFETKRESLKSKSHLTTQSASLHLLTDELCPI